MAHYTCFKARMSSPPQQKSCVPIQKINADLCISPGTTSTTCSLASFSASSKSKSPTTLTVSEFCKKTEAMTGQACSKPLSVTGSKCKGKDKGKALLKIPAAGAAAAVTCSSDSQAAYPVRKLMPKPCRGTASSGGICSLKPCRFKVDTKRISPLATCAGRNVCKLLKAKRSSRVSCSPCPEVKCRRDSQCDGAGYGNDCGQGECGQGAKECKSQEASNGASGRESSDEISLDDDWPDGSEQLQGERKCQSIINLDDLRDLGMLDGVHNVLTGMVFSSAVLGVVEQSGILEEPSRDECPWFFGVVNNLLSPGSLAGDNIYSAHTDSGHRSWIACLLWGDDE